MQNSLLVRRLAWNSQVMIISVWVFGISHSYKGVANTAKVKKTHHTTELSFSMCGSWPCAVKPWHFLQHLAFKSHSELFRSQIASDVFSWIKILALTHSQTKSRRSFCYVESPFIVHLYLQYSLKIHNTMYASFICLFCIIRLYNYD